jgi:hypothetical protein
LEAHEVLSFVTDLHSLIVAKSVPEVIHPPERSEVLPVSQTTQLDHHSTSVLAIKANHALSTQFLFATKYIYFPFASPL